MVWINMQMFGDVFKKSIIMFGGTIMFRDMIIFGDMICCSSYLYIIVVLIIDTN